MKKLVDEEKRELLQEVIFSPGWGILCDRVLPDLLNSYTANIFASARNVSNDDIQVAIGKYDGALELFRGVYEAAGLDLPEFFSKLRKGT